MSKEIDIIHLIFKNKEWLVSDEGIPITILILIIFYYSILKILKKIKTFFLPKTFKKNNVQIIKNEDPIKTQINIQDNSGKIEL